MFSYHSCYDLDMNIEAWPGINPLPTLAIKFHMEEIIMAITRWDPFREVASLQNRLNSLFRDINEADSPLTTAALCPPSISMRTARKSSSSSKCRASKRRTSTSASKTTP